MMLARSVGTSVDLHRSRHSGTHCSPGTNGRPLTATAQQVVWVASGVRRQAVRCAGRVRWLLLITCRNQEVSTCCSGAMIVVDAKRPAGLQDALGLLHRLREVGSAQHKGVACAHFGPVGVRVAEPPPSQRLIAAEEG